jgi:hypothetical protein
LKFLFPKSHAGFWHARARTSFMTVPKTTMHKNYAPVLFEHNIGSTDYICRVQSIAKSHRPNHSSDREFRPGVFRLDERHLSTSFLIGQWIAPFHSYSKKASTVCTESSSYDPPKSPARATVAVDILLSQAFPRSLRSNSRCVHFYSAGPNVKMASPLGLRQELCCCLANLN